MLNQQLVLHIQGVPFNFPHYFEESDEIETLGESNSKAMSNKASAQQSNFTLGEIATSLIKDISLTTIGGYKPQRVDLVLYGEEQAYMSRYKKGNITLSPIEEEVHNSILNGNKIRFYIPQLRFALGKSRGYVTIWCLENDTYPDEGMFSYAQRDITYTREYIEIKLHAYI
jgi:hypothetical protein